jgi:hypothetical protein
MQGVTPIPPKEFSQKIIGWKNLKASEQLKLFKKVNRDFEQIWSNILDKKLDETTTNEQFALGYIQSHVRFYITGYIDTMDSLGVYAEKDIEEIESQDSNLKRKRNYAAEKMQQEVPMKKVFKTLNEIIKN